MSTKLLSILTLISPTKFDTVSRKVISDRVLDDSQKLLATINAPYREFVKQLNCEGDISSVFLG